MDGRFLLRIVTIVGIFASCASAVVAWQEDLPSPQSAGSAVETAEDAPAEPKDGVDPGDEPSDLEVQDVRSASFQNVRPGETTAAEAREMLGEPAFEETKEGVTTLSYRVEPFAKVDVQIEGKLTTWIIIHLKRPTPAAQIAKDLEFDTFRPVPIPDDKGQLLGISYPERGVTLGLTADAKENLVSQVLLEGISAEPFVLRALYDGEHRYEQALADVNYARKLDPREARAPWLKARVLAAMGRTAEALVESAAAVELAPNSIVYRLAHAQTLSEAGDYAQAVGETRAALAMAGLTSEVRAQGECQLGNLLVMGPAKGYKEAVERYQAALKLALPLANHRAFAVRRTAKQVLVDAHLGVAHCIAHGQWKNKDDAAPKWLARAEFCAQDFLETDRGDELLKLVTARKTLAALAGLRTGVDPTVSATTAIAESRRLLEGDRDPYFLRQVARELGQAMHDAARLEQLRRQPDRALDYLARAIPSLELDLAHRRGSAAERCLLGKLYFSGGSVQAILKQSHDEAIIWYDKAAPLLIEVKSAATNEKGLHGERLVSMGVSYWETGSKEEAIRLTRTGVEFLEEAAREATWEKTALAVPYGNLASMHKDLGQEAQAQEYAALAAQLEPADAVKRR